MTSYSELRVHCTAEPSAVKPLRHALTAFLNVAQIDADLCSDILTAVGEALTNAVEHAYAVDPQAEPGRVELIARLDNTDWLYVDILDQGRFIHRDRRPGRGFGLRIVRAIASEVTVNTDDGTRVRMVFNTQPGTSSSSTAL